MTIDGCQIVTIKPEVRAEEVAKYQLEVVAHPGTETWWCKPGMYDTIDDLLNTFSPELKPANQAAVIQKLTDGNQITFSLVEVLGHLK